MSLRNLSIKKYKNLLFPAFLLAISVSYLASSLLLGSPIVNGRLTPSFFPMLLGGGSILLSIIYLTHTLKEYREEWREVEEVEEVTVFEGLLPYLVVLSTLVYISVFPFIGYFLSSLVYVFSIIIIFSNPHKLISKFMLALCVVGLGYVLFEQVFRVRLPVFWG